MTVHSSGAGTSWNETLDVDQPHGLDYQEWNDIRIGVRKRIAEEHSSFADSTVGGIHKPGGAAVLGINDGTPGAADGTYRGHGLVWDNTSRLWCSTAVAGASTSGDQTVVLLHPDKQWGGQDVTWTGAHEFDASVDISGNVAMDGDLTVDGNVLFDGTFLPTSCATDLGGFLDEDDFDSDATAAVASQQSIKAYVANGIIQVINTQTGASSTTAVTMTSDDSIPQITEGAEFMTAIITPTSATNKLKIDVVIQVSNSVLEPIVVGLFQDATANALAATGALPGLATGMITISFAHFMTAGTAVATTFRVRIGRHSAGTVTFNGVSGVRRFGGVAASSITVTEIRV